jgi:type II secretory pathway predicted ATPase ExeA
MLKLKKLLADIGLSQAALGRAVELSGATISLIANRNQWPGSLDRKELQGRLAAALLKAGADSSAIESAFEPEGEPSLSSEDAIMLLEAYRLSEPQLAHFGLRRSPFLEPQGPEDLFMWGEALRVREELYAAARSGGFVALVGESGSGKTTLTIALEDQLLKDGDVTLITPHVEQMEQDDRKGRTLKAAQIAEAILRAAAPTQKMRASSEARLEQVKSVLFEGKKARQHFVLLIEEADKMPTPTLRHLKRFMEMRVGYQRFLAIILVGQPELVRRLDPKDLSVREVVQRCGPIALPAMSEADLRGYLRHRFGRVGVGLEQVVNDAGISALFQRLSDARLCYPLAAHNLLARAMAGAALVKAPVVTDREVRGVR